MLARPTAHRGVWADPLSRASGGNSLQEGQIPARTALRLSVALGQIFIQFGLGSRLINVGRSQYARAFLTRVSP